MNPIRSLTLALASMLLAACSSFSGPDSPALPASAQWGIVPVVNFSQAPQAGERAEQILLSVLGEEGLQPRMYPAVNQGDDVPLLDDRERQRAALDWAREQKLDYVVTGSVEEWQYKNGLDGEPAVGISLQVIEPASGRIVWSNSGARSGWSRESLAGNAQKVLRKLVSDLRLQ
ncbi:penicillin-binding protein activator LpoB [Pseudomonas sp. LRF_L74]|uniref:penicillin-binding protein activator LpoB n=1 Tax=Pseudomonas sp. LRF_L74 TaxID=3369422 RepID=UPI003F5FF8F9